MQRARARKLSRVRSPSRSTVGMGTVAAPQSLDELPRVRPSHMARRSLVRLTSELLYSPLMHQLQR